MSATLAYGAVAAVVAAALAAMEWRGPGRLRAGRVLAVIASVLCLLVMALRPTRARSGDAAVVTVVTRGASRAMQAADFAVGLTQPGIAKSAACMARLAPRVTTVTAAVSPLRALVGRRAITSRQSTDTITASTRRARRRPGPRHSIPASPAATTAAIAAYASVALTAVPPAARDTPARSFPPE